MFYLDILLLFLIQFSAKIARQVGYECIAEVVNIYYEKLDEYINAIFEITMKTIDNDVAFVSRTF